MSVVDLHPLPPVPLRPQNYCFSRVPVTPEKHYRIRHRETFDEMVGRDHYKKEGEKNEVFCH